MCLRTELSAWVAWRDVETGLDEANERADGNASVMRRKNTGSIVSIVDERLAISPGRFGFQSVKGGSEREHEFRIGARATARDNDRAAQCQTGESGNVECVAH